MNRTKEDKWKEGNSGREKSILLHATYASFVVRTEV